MLNLTDEGEKIGASMMRNSRLLEVLMDSALKVEIDEEMVCGIEHHMNKQFTDALCTMLKHPRKCPHGHDIPCWRMLFQLILNLFFIYYKFVPKKRYISN